MDLRLATQEDLPTLVDIYNQAIMAGEKTADMDIFTVASRQAWFDSHCDERYPLIVSEVEGKVVGYVSLSAYRPGRQAFINTVEISYYIDFDYHGKKFGAIMINEILAYAEKLNYQTVVAMLIESNFASIKLLERNGFQRWGFLPDVADFHGKRLGHLFYGKRFE